MTSLTTSGITSKRREFLTVAEELALLNGQTVRLIREESESQGISPVQVALQKALITPTQLDIIETLCRPFEVVPGYEVRSVIGQGGMGVVFRAKQLSLKRDVAIKLVPLHQLGGNVAVKRFEVEAQVVAKLSHPNIVAAYDFGQHEGRLYFVMEFVDGEDADHHIRRHGCFEEHAAWHVVRQATAGLAHAKQAGVVHRDVKPANILLVRPPAGYPLPAGVPMAKLGDFGLAWLTTASDEKTRLTATNITLGSPHYMAPEQLTGASVDWRADIYSLGATAFHLLAGLPPHSGLEITRLMALKLQGKCESLRVVRPDLSLATTQLVDELMAGDPKDRPQDYGVLIERIDALIGSEITGSRRISTSGRALASTQISKPEEEISSPRLEPVDPDAVTQTELPPGPNAATVPIPEAAIPPQPSRRNWVLVGFAAAMVLLAACAAILNFTKLPGQPDLEPAGDLFALPFDVKTGAFDRWSRGYGSRWYEAANSDNENVLYGDGLIVRRFADVTGNMEGLPYYSLELFAEMYQAKVIEVHVDFAGKGPGGAVPQRDDHRVVLRLTKEGSQLGTKSGDRQGWVPRSPFVKFRKAEGKHEIRLERHTSGWWAMVDEDVVGFMYSRIAHDANEFRLIAEDGEARFSDFHVQELRGKNGRGKAAE